jgi:hypothetical protein
MMMVGNAAAARIIPLVAFTLVRYALLVAARPDRVL